MIASVVIQVTKANGKTTISFNELFEDYKYELGKSLYAAEIISEAFNTDDVFFDVCNAIDNIEINRKTYTSIADWHNTDYQTKVEIKAKVTD